MATSTRSTSRRASTRTEGSTARRASSSPQGTPRTDVDTTSSRRARDVSRLKHYTFRYNLDRVSRKAGSSNLTIASNGTNTSVTLTLQEARALYNFLDGHFDNA